MKTFCFLLFFTIILESCSSIYFAQPQPQGGATLKSFPKEFQGSYIGEDKDTVYIKKNKYVYPEIFEKHIPMVKLDSLADVRIEDGLLFDDSIPTNKGIRFTITADTLHYRIKLNLSKFLSDSLVIKKHKGLLILNKKEKEENYWKVYLIEKLNNDDLRLSTIGNFKTEETPNQKIKYDGVLEDFYSITRFQKIDTSKYLINPTYKEFKKLLKKGLFAKWNEYKKIANKR